MNHRSPSAITPGDDDAARVKGLGDKRWSNVKPRGLWGLRVKQLREEEGGGKREGEKERGVGTPYLYSG